MANGTMVDRLVVALDVESGAKAIKLVDKLKGRVGMFKIGKQLFTAEGPQIVRRIRDLGERIFLDLKFHDIPNTVANAGVEAARLGVSIFNIHALGGSAMMRRTSEAVAETAECEGFSRPLILGVTVLTSHDQASLAEVGIERKLEDEVTSLARLCEAAGIDGVVASPREILQIRKAVSRPGFVILVGGVRPAWAARDDQMRVLTPAECARAGADYLVVGRPIIAAPDPVLAAQKILEEMELTTACDV